MLTCNDCRTRTLSLEDPTLIAHRAFGALPETSVETSVSMESSGTTPSRSVDRWIARAGLGLALVISWSVLGASEATEGVSPAYVPLATPATPSAALAEESQSAPEARLLLTVPTHSGPSRASLPESFSLSQHDFFKFIVIDWAAMRVEAPLSTPR